MPSEYAFEYGCIRLSERHYQQWKRVYQYLDLDAALTSLEPWAARQDNWFMAVSGALNKRNQAEHQKRLQRMGYNGIEGVL